MLDLYSKNDNEVKIAANQDSSDDSTNRIFKILPFLILSILCVSITTIFIFFSLLMKVFFQSLIVYRGYSLYLPPVPYLTKIQDLLHQLDEILNIPGITYLFYPFIKIYAALASINVNFSAINVTCEGSTGSLKLLVNLFIVGMVIIIIESDYESFFTVSMKSIIQKNFKSVLNSRLYKYISPQLVLLHSFICFVVSVIIGINPIQTILQFSMSLLSIGVFFPRHKTTEACNLVIGAENFDIVLAILSSTVVYLLIIPTFYIVARIITPTRAENIQILDNYKTGDELTRIDDDDDLTRNKNARRITYIEQDSSNEVNSKRVTIRMNRVTDAFFASDIRNELKNINNIHTVNCVQCNCDGSKFLSGSDESLQIWNFDGSRINSLHKKSAAVLCACFSSDGSQIVSGGLDHNVILWDTDKGEIIDVFKGHNAKVTGVLIDKDGSIIYSCSFDKSARIWDITGTHEVLKLQHPAEVSSISLSLNGELLISGCNDFNIRLWNSKNGELNRVFKGHFDSIKTVAFRDDEYFASSGKDKIIKIWHKKSDEALISFPHTSIVNSICFSINGNRLVSGSEDSSVTVWEVNISDRTIKEFLSFEGHTKTVNSVAYVRNDELVISGSKDGSIRIWNATKVIDPISKFSFIKHYFFLVLKFCSFDVYLLTIVSTWLSAFRMNFIQGKNSNTLLENWKTNAKKENSSYIRSRCDELSYNDATKKTDVCFADISGKRTLDETRKWKNSWNSKIPNYIELCYFEYDEFKEVIENHIKANEVEGLPKCCLLLYRWILCSLAILSIFLGISHFITKMGLGNFQFAGYAYWDFICW